MIHKSISKKLSILLIALLITFIPFSNVSAHTTIHKLPLILLSSYSQTLPIGGSYHLIALTLDGSTPTFSSNKSTIAKVTTHGLITAKKAGKCKITAKTKTAEATCIVTVSKTKIVLNKTSVTTEKNRTFHLDANTSTNNTIKWKSSKSSVASVDQDGTVTTKKSGTARITATIDGSSASCTVNVKVPTIKLSSYYERMYRNNYFYINAVVSSGDKPKWKSSKTSVATVDSNGKVYGVKHGSAIITATVDGVSKMCLITIDPPIITLSKGKLTMKVNSKDTLMAHTSSGNPVTWSSSNINIVTVDSNGRLQARQKGKAYIYAQEDGAKVSCIVTVK